MTSPIVEILLSTFNGATYLPEMLDSIQKQTYQQFKLLIRDDCSTDNTNDLLKKYDQLPSEKNLGVIGSFSKLLTASTAPYVMFADQDDYWLPQKIEKTLQKMKELEKEHGPHTPILIHTDLTVTDHCLNTISPSFWKYSHLNPYQKKQFGSLLVQNTVTGCTMMINRSLANLVGEIPLSVTMHDHWIALVAASLGKIGVLSESTILYRQHHNNHTGATRYSFSLIDKILFSKKNLIQKTLNRKMQKKMQAKSLLKQYKKSLPLSKRNTIEAYLSFDRSRILKRFKLMKRFGLKSTGLLHNIKELIY